MSNSSSNPLTHTRSCPRLARPEDDCTCGLEFRIALSTEQTMHAAWRKRAEEAEIAAERLTAELAEWKSERELCYEKYIEHRAERDRLRAALKRYGRHDPANDCQSGCLCGLDAALAGAADETSHENRAWRPRLPMAPG